MTLRGSHDVVAVRQLARGRVTTDVHERVALVHDVGAEPGEPVDDAVDGVLVARDQRRREDHGVALADPDAVVVGRHPRQRRHRLALRAGGDEHDLVVGQLVDDVDGDDEVRRDPQVAEVARDAHVAHHRAADEGDLAVDDVRRRRGSAGRGARGEAKHATMIRRSAWLNTASSVGSMSRSVRTKPGTSALVESTRKRSTPSSPSRANARRSVIRPSSGSWSILKSPVCRTSCPAGVRIATASASGIEWLTATNSALKGPELLDLALLDLQRVGLDPVLAQLGLDQRQGQPGADERDVRSLAQEVGHGADVVLVPVGEDDRLDGVEAVRGCSRSPGGSGRRPAGCPRGRAPRSRR